MKVSLALSDFPMEYFERFREDLSNYVVATVNVGGADTVFVNFEADMIHTQEAVIICDKYAFKNPR